DGQGGHRGRDLQHAGGQPRLPGADDLFRGRGPVPHRSRSLRATSTAKYVSTWSAPARWMPRTDSIIAASRSIQPFAAAAWIIAYSPDTWYAATGTGDMSATSRTMSR